MAQKRRSAEAYRCRAYLHPHNVVPALGEFRQWQCRVLYLCHHALSRGIARAICHGQVERRQQPGGCEHESTGTTTATHSAVEEGASEAHVCNRNYLGAQKSLLGQPEAQPLAGHGKRNQRPNPGTEGAAPSLFSRSVHRLPDGAGGGEVIPGCKTILWKLPNTTSDTQTQHLEYKSRHTSPFTKSKTCHVKGEITNRSGPILRLTGRSTSRDLPARRGQTAGNQAQPLRHGPGAGSGTP